LKQSEISDRQSFSAFSNPALERRIRKTVWIIVGAAVTLVLIYWLVLTVVAHAPEKASGRFIDDLTSSNSVAAYELTYPGFRTQISKSQLAAYDKKITDVITGPPQLYDKEVYIFGKSSSYAVMLYKAPALNKSRELYIKTDLAKINGQWQVSYIYINGSPEQPTLDTKPALHYRAVL
jgi:hypothetical protein